MRQEEGAYSTWEGGWLFHMLAKGAVAYPGEGAY